MTQAVVQENIGSISEDHERRIQALERRGAGAYYDYIFVDNPNPWLGGPKYDDIFSVGDITTLGYLNYVNRTPPWGWKIGPEGLVIRKADDHLQMLGTIRWTGVIPDDFGENSWWSNVYSICDFGPDTDQWGVPVTFDFDFSFQQISILGHEADGSNPEIYEMFVSYYTGGPGVSGRMWLILLGGPYVPDEPANPTVPFMLGGGGTGIPLRSGEQYLPPRPGLPANSNQGTIEGYTLNLSGVYYSQNWPSLDLRVAAVAADPHADPTLPPLPKAAFTYASHIDG